MYFRQAEMKDLDAIEAIYEAIHTGEELGRTTIGWKRGIYPTRETAKAAVEAGELFVEEDQGKIVGAAKINQEQVPEYALAEWKYPAAPDQVMVMHTLTIDPARKGNGYGSAFEAFYEDYARLKGCLYLRIDTNERNTPARTLYHKLGYSERGIVPCTFNGIEGVQLVCLEKKL